MAKRKEEPAEKILDVDASIQGTIVFKDPVNLRINGDFDGKLETKGSLTIGETANVTANIEGDHIAIAGNVVGDITAASSLAIVAPAKIKGNVFTPTLSVTEGAIIDGKLTMGGTSPAEESLLDLQEVSSYLEVEEGVLAEWARKKKIPATFENNEWKFKKSEVDQWIQREKVQV